MSTPAGRPTYQDCLRAIGRYFDRNVYRHVLVAEVDDGYIARAFPGGQQGGRAEGIALPLNDVLSLINTQVRARGVALNDVKLPPLCPTGYEDFFRALGWELDAVTAMAVSIVELSGGILASYSSGSPKNPERAQMFYDPPKIDDLLTKAYQRRGKG